MNAAPIIGATALAALTLGGGALSRAAALAVGPTAMVAESCPAPPPSPSAEVMRSLLTPGVRFTPPSPKAIAAGAKAALQGRERDWAGLCRYRAADVALQGSSTVPTRVVFMGDSITEFWGLAEPDLFTRGVVDRGISGQTSPQMLLRFRADVVDLKPGVVHILAGTNDVAGNTGPTTERDFENNIETMVELARLHHIRVLLGAIPPSAFIGWKPDYRPAGEIVRLNTWLKGYAAFSGSVFVDYHAALTTPEGGFRPDLSNDGVHPNRRGYAIMRRLAEQAIAEAATAR